MLGDVHVHSSHKCIPEVLDTVHMVVQDLGHTHTTQTALLEFGLGRHRAVASTTHRCDPSQLLSDVLQHVTAAQDEGGDDPDDSLSINSILLRAFACLGNGSRRWSWPAAQNEWPNGCS